jgi:hypothetical protein
MAEAKDNPPTFCEKFCIICKGASEGNTICKYIQDIELKIFGKNGCIGERQERNITELLLIKNSQKNYLKLKNIKITN